MVHIFAFNLHNVISLPIMQAISWRVFTVKTLDTFGIFKCSCCFYSGKVLLFSRVHNATYLGKSATIHIFSKAMADFSKGMHMLSPQTDKWIKSLFCMFEIHNMRHHESTVSFPNGSMCVEKNI